MNLEYLHIFLSVFNHTVDAAGQMQKEFQGKGFKWKTLLSIDILGLTPNRVILMFQSVPKYEICFLLSDDTCRIL